MTMSSRLSSTTMTSSQTTLSHMTPRHMTSVHTTPDTKAPSNGTFRSRKSDYITSKHLTSGPELPSHMTSSQSMTLDILPNHMASKHKKSPLTSSLVTLNDITSSHMISNQSMMSGHVTASFRGAVKRLKAENIEKFLELVTSHLSIQLDLDGDALAEILDNNDVIGPAIVDPASEELLRTPFTPFTPLFRRKKQSKVTNTQPSQLFGVSLSSRNIERILPLIKFLKRPENLKLEGLFRKNGNVERQRALRDNLNNLEQVDFLSNGYTTHDCASVLKTFLGELPEPLLTTKHFNAYTQVAAMKDESKQISSLELLVQLLPSENSCLLRHLLSLLTKVIQEQENLMDAHNLAIVFTMHVVIPKKLSADDQRSAADRLTNVIELMITHADLVLNSYPNQLVADVTQYLIKAGSAPGSAASLRRISSGITSGTGTCSLVGHVPARASGRKISIISAPLTMKNEATVAEEVEDEEDDDEIVITSSVVFADRQASTEAATTSNTATALAQLYEHIACMPESTKKRKLMNKMNQSYDLECADALKHSLTKSLQKIFSTRKRHREKPATKSKHPLPAVHCNTPSLGPPTSNRKLPFFFTPSVGLSVTKRKTPRAAFRSPVARLFIDELTDQQNVAEKQSYCSTTTQNSQTQRPSEPFYREMSPRMRNSRLSSSSSSLVNDREPIHDTVTSSDKPLSLLSHSASTAIGTLPATENRISITQSSNSPPGAPQYRRSLSDQPCNSNDDKVISAVIYQSDDEDSDKENNRSVTIRTPGNLQTKKTINIGVTPETQTIFDALLRSPPLKSIMLENVVSCRTPPSTSSSSARMRMTQEGGFVGATSMGVELLKGYISPLNYLMPCDLS